MAIEREFWNGKRVFVTGHSGFKGTWLCAWLAEMGAEVTGYALAPRMNPSLYALAGLDRRTRGLHGDVRERHTLAAAMRIADPEIIFHLAAQPLVKQGLKDPRGTFETNVMGTVNLLDVARAMNRTKGIIVVTSDKCYERTNKSCRERDPLGGLEPYSASKASAEHVVASFRHCYFNKSGCAGLASARAGNVIGGGDFSPNRLIPDIIRAVAAGRPVVLRNPKSVRPWQHVLDALAGYLELAQALAVNPVEIGDSYNFGPPGGAEWTVEEVAKTAMSRLGRGTLEIDEDRLSLETSILRINSQRARERLGWAAQIPTTRALRLTIDGYQQLIRDAKADWLFQQIDDYQGNLKPKRKPIQRDIAGSEKGHAIAIR